MFRRTVMALGVAGAAVGIPYAASEWPKLKANVFGGGNSNSATSALKPISASSYPASNDPGSPSIIPYGGVNSQVDQTPLVEMTEAFRWDVSPQWVMSRWPRVSSGLPAENLNGMRVTLISGLQLDDVAGSLTYYFNSSQRCAKLMFTGTTGDPNRLVALLTERYGFKGYLSDQPGVLRYEIRWNGDAHSTFNVRPAPVVRNSSPFEKYVIQVSILDPAVK